MRQQLQKHLSGSGNWLRRCLFLATFSVALNAAVARCEDLDALVQQALERNPAILAARRAVDARKSLIAAARTLPDPSVSFETMGNPYLTLQRGDPSSARVLRFSQEIPFPGKLSLQGQIASAEADAEAWKYEHVRRVVVTELKMSYYDLLLAQKLTDVVEKSRTLLQQFAEIICQDDPRVQTQTLPATTLLACQRSAAQPIGRCMMARGCNGYILATPGTAHLKPDCPTRMWNPIETAGGLVKNNWCVLNNSPCNGCASPGFPDYCSPFYEVTKGSWKGYSYLKPQKPC